MTDARAIARHVLARTDIDASSVFLHGRSLGGAVAVYLASLEKEFSFRGAVIENTFASLESLVTRFFPFIRIPFVKWLVLRNFWPSIDRIAGVRMPLLYVLSL